MKGNQVLFVRFIVKWNQQSGIAWTLWPSTPIRSTGSLHFQTQDFAWIAFGKNLEWTATDHGTICMSARHPACLQFRGTTGTRAGGAAMTIMQ